MFIKNKTKVVGRMSEELCMLESCFYLQTSSRISAAGHSGSGRYLSQSYEDDIKRKVCSLSSHKDDSSEQVGR